MIWDVIGAVLGVGFITLLISQIVRWVLYWVFKVTTNKLPWITFGLSLVAIAFLTELNNMPFGLYLPGLVLWLIVDLVIEKRSKRTQCPLCKETIMLGAVVCKHCQREISN